MGFGSIHPRLVQGDCVVRTATATSVAVIGMACRLPGGIDSPQRLWEALLRGDDLVGEIPADRWDANVYYDPEPGVPGRSVSRWGAFLDDVGGFDCDFFGLTEREATAIDPQHRLLLEVSWEAIEHAGVDPATLAESQTGVFVGLTHGDYELLSADCGAAEGPYGFTGTSNSFASGRVAYTLGLHGPAVTVDTACSSGLTAVHQACRSLDDGESDLALAGGVVVTLEPRKSVSGSLQGMLSPTGRCHAFDEAADGFVSGEGCVVLLLKRLPDAVRDGGDGRSPRHRHPRWRSGRIREPGRGVRNRGSVRADVGENKLRSPAVGIGAPGVDEDNPGVAAWGCAAEPALLPAA